MYKDPIGKRKREDPDILAVILPHTKRAKSKAKTAQSDSENNASKDEQSTETLCINHPYNTEVTTKHYRG